MGTWSTWRSRSSRGMLLDGISVCLEEQKQHRWGCWDVDLWLEELGGSETWTGIWCDLSSLVWFWTMRLHWCQSLSTSWEAPRCALVFCRELCQLGLRGARWCNYTGARVLLRVWSWRASGAMSGIWYEQWTLSSMKASRLSYHHQMGDCWERHPKTAYEMNAVTGGEVILLDWKITEDYHQLPQDTY